LVTRGGLGIIEIRLGNWEKMVNHCEEAKWQNRECSEE